MFALQQEVAQKRIAVNANKNKPSFGAGLDDIMVNQRSDAEPSGNGRDIIQLRGSVKIPLYQAQYEAKEREERMKIDALDLRKEETLTQFEALIEKAFIDIETARLSLELATEQIKLTQSAMKILEGQYSAKGKGMEELLRLEQNLNKYELMRLQAIVQSHQAKSRIEQLVNL